MKWTSAANAFELPMTVIADDIDEQGIAYNVTIIDWMMRAAIAHSTALGFDRFRYAELESMFVVRRHEIDYHRSARLGDELILRTWPSFMKAATAHRKHEVVAHDGTVIAKGMNVWAYVDRNTGRPKRMPPEVLESFDINQFL
ncbi:MAG: acyl-CoA thioesterase [Proteobacteria bacterium]|nr:acyl-CoA thioesterase [Pseudomonadota bacterium]